MERTRQAAFGVWRVVFMLLVTYGFTIILMTAAVQQQVAAELARTHPDLDYSSAYLQSLKLDDLQAENDKRAEKEARLLAAADAARLASEEAVTAAEDGWRDFRAAVPRARLEAACAAPAETDYPSLWSWTSQCAEDAPLSDRDRVRLTRVWETRPTAMDLHRDAESAQRDFERKRAALNEAQSALKAGRENAAAGSKLSEAFDDTKGLSATWLLGGQVFVGFSPLLLQILLALAAGAFGALLLTLILAVYPKDQFRFTTGQGFEARILLGGLISVCVYVVLSGGASILGGAGNLSEVPTNVMTFCAVGILAGMFSDRVAFWLSDRADVFFSRGEPDPASTARPRPSSSQSPPLPPPPTSPPPPPSGPLSPPAPPKV